MNVFREAGEAIRRLAQTLEDRQASDGSWRFCFENGELTDAYLIILLRTLEAPEERLIRQLHDRILASQRPDGAWSVYDDETEGNLSASVECCYALLYSGYSRASDPAILKAKHYILSKGGLRRISGVLTKVILAATGQYPWPSSLTIPLEFLLLPSSFPISMFDFSGFGRAHMIPMMLLADRRFSIQTNLTPNLSDLMGYGDTDMNRPEAGSNRPSRELSSILALIAQGIDSLSGIPSLLHEEAEKKAERDMLDRIEQDGTFYGYATSTVLMVFSLLAIGYDKRHPVIIRAVEGLKTMLCGTPERLFLQNSSPEVWDTALLCYALQEAGVPANHEMIHRSALYLLGKQHTKRGDWSVHNPNAEPGGWGVSDSNTFNPDVDDTTAALRAIRRFAGNRPAYRKAWNRGLSWTLSMQNRDGGWPSFEKGTDRELLAHLPIEGAQFAIVDPSTPDLTGRTLEFLGRGADLRLPHAFVRRGVDWLFGHQEADGSWYGRWGVCYLYGTWAALTGMAAVGVPADHDAVRQGTRWLLGVQNPDGGWGESCRSDVVLRYVPLGASTPSQTAWALDALVAFHDAPTPEIVKGAQRLIDQMQENDWKTRYPTGAGLPGVFYTRYHSYRYIWPLLALSHFQNKFADS